MTMVSNKVALVTGGAGGLGFALAKALAQGGAFPVIADIDGGAAAGAAEKLQSLGFDALSVPLDVSCPESWNLAVGDVENKAGPIGLLFNNAGVSALGTRIIDMDYGLWRKVLAINLDGVFLGVKAVMPRMIAQGIAGHIVNTASLAGLGVSRPGIAHYASSKCAVVAFTESLAAEVPEYGIGATVICPGAVRSNLWKSTNQVLGLPASDVPPAASVKSGSASPQALDPDLAARRILEGVQADRLYVTVNAQSVRADLHARNNAIIKALDIDSFEQDYANIA